MKYLLSTTLIFFNTLLFAQINLVPNFSFEDYSNCPNGYGQLNYVQFWYPSNGTSSDYFNQCTSDAFYSTPNNWLGSQSPKTGIAYAGIGLYYNGYTNYREYVGCELNESLLPNKFYCVKFHVSLADSAQFATSSIGAYISENSNLLTGGGVLNYVPQIENSDTIILDDKQNWMTISGCFKANGGEKYLTIGCFYDDTKINLLTLQNHGITYGINTCYYYIDDVSLVLDTTQNINEYNSETFKFELFPNPAKEALSLKYNISNNASLNIYDILGAKRKALTIESNLNEIVLDLNNYNIGLYFYSISDQKGNRIKTGTFVIE